MAGTSSSQVKQIGSLLDYMAEHPADELHVNSVTVCDANEKWIGDIVWDSDTESFRWTQAAS